MAGDDKNNEGVKDITKKLTSVVIDEIEPEEYFTPFPDTGVQIDDGYYIHLDADSDA